MQVTPTYPRVPLVVRRESTLAAATDSGTDMEAGGWLRSARARRIAEASVSLSCSSCRVREGPNPQHRNQNMRRDRGRASGADSTRVHSHCGTRPVHSATCVRESTDMGGVGWEGSERPAHGPSEEPRNRKNRSASD